MTKCQVSSRIVRKGQFLRFAIGIYKTFFSI